MNPFVDMIALIRSQVEQKQSGSLCLGQLSGLEPPAITYMDTHLSLPVTLPKGIDPAQITGNERCLFLLDGEVLLVLALY